MKFLETITGLGNDVLVPISKIELIWCTYGANGWEIHIKGQEQYEWVEHFGKESERFNRRYEMIKYLLDVPKEADVLEEIKSKEVSNAKFKRTALK